MKVLSLDGIPDHYNKVIVLCMLRLNYEMRFVACFVINRGFSKAVFIPIHREYPAQGSIDELYFGEFIARALFY